MFASKNRIRTAACLVALGAIAGLGCSSESPGTTEVTPNVGTPPPAGSGTPQARMIMLTETEFRFTPSSAQANTGESVTFMVNNVGTMQHGFVLHLPSGDVSLPRLLSPGETDQVTATMPSSPGQFQWICPVPGHAQLGMVGTLTVSQGTATTGRGTSTGSGATSSGSTGATSGGSTGAGGPKY